MIRSENTCGCGEHRSPEMARDEETLRRKILATIRRIPRGRVATYGQISEMIDRRLTPVGVGWAVRAASDTIPWQRVINSRGTVSTDKTNPGLQRSMLEAEGVVFDHDGTVDLARFCWRPRR